MASHREILEKTVADAEAKHRIALDVLQARVDAMKATNASISDLQRRYDAACLAVADGNAKAEDPSALQGEIQRLEHRLRGETQLHTAALNAHVECNRELVEASKVLQAHNDQAELERMSKAIDAAKANVASVTAALEEANRVWRKAENDRYMFTKKLEREARQVA